MLKKGDRQCINTSTLYPDFLLEGAPCDAVEALDQRTIHVIFLRSQLLLAASYLSNHHQIMSSSRVLSGGAEVTISRQQSIRLVGGDDESAVEDVVAPENAQPAMRPVSRRRQMSILLCAFLDVFVTIGMNQAYGVFLSYYLADGSSSKDPFLSKSETTSKAMVAFVGTLAAGLTWGGSIFVNPIMARCKDPRWITGAGAVFIGSGYVLASFCHKASVIPSSYRYLDLTLNRYGNFS